MEFFSSSRLELSWCAIVFGSSAAFSWGFFFLNMLYTWEERYWFSSFYHWRKSSLKKIKKSRNHNKASILLISIWWERNYWEYCCIFYLYWYSLACFNKNFNSVFMIFLSSWTVLDMGFLNSSKNLFNYSWLFLLTSLRKINSWRKFHLIKFGYSWQ